jgi:hypothetical protein
LKQLYLLLPDFQYDLDQCFSLSRFIGGEKWKNPRLEISRITGNVLALVGAISLP